MAVWAGDTPSQIVTPTPGVIKSHPQLADLRFVEMTAKSYYKTLQWDMISIYICALIFKNIVPIMQIRKAWVMMHLDFSGFWFLPVFVHKQIVLIVVAAGSWHQRPLEIKLWSC